MNHLYPGQRLRIVAALSIAGFLALSSYWLSLVIKNNGGGDNKKTARNVPDYHVEDFNFVKMSDQGRPRYHIHGMKMTHYPQKGTLHIERPVVKNLDQNAPEQTLVSKRAVLTDDNSKLHLHGNVQFSRAAVSDSNALHLKSSYLLMLLDDDIIKTDKAVTIHHGSSTLNGVGLYANNVTREFRVLDQVKIKVPPPDQE